MEQKNGRMKMEERKWKKEYGRNKVEK